VRAAVAKESTNRASEVCCASGSGIAARNSAPHAPSDSKHGRLNPVQWMLRFGGRLNQAPTNCAAGDEEGELRGKIEPRACRHAALEIRLGV
jgi:hypothetical protein